MAPRRGIIKTVHSANQRVFCDLMVQARKKAGLTQQRLAYRLRRPQSFVAKYERGERRLDVLEFVVVARAIGVNPINLMKRLMKGIGK